MPNNEDNKGSKTLDEAFKMIVIAAIVIGAGIMFYNYASEPARSYDDCWTETCKDRFNDAAVKHLMRGGR